MVANTRLLNRNIGDHLQIDIPVVKNLDIVDSAGVSTGKSIAFVFADWTFEVNRVLRNEITKLPYFEKITTAVISETPASRLSLIPEDTKRYPLTKAGYAWLSLYIPTGPWAFLPDVDLRLVATSKANVGTTATFLWATQIAE